MPEVCIICSSVISRTNPGIQCQGPCKNHSHLKCVKLPAALGDLAADSGVAWRCRGCKDELPSNESAKMLQELIIKVNAVMSEICDLRKKQSDFGDSVKFYGDKIDDFNKQMEVFTKLSKNVDDIQYELLSVKKECAQFKAQIEFLHQQGRKNNIEICGVPEKRGEDVIFLVKKVGEAIGITIGDADVAAGHRVARFANGTNNYPKNIIATLTSHNKKAAVLAAAKKCRNPGINAAAIGFSQDTKIFVNEHLSPFYKALHKRSREFCKNANYKYCWVKDMKIYIKKDDSSRAVHIENESVLLKLESRST